MFDVVCRAHNHSRSLRQGQHPNAWENFMEILRDPLRVLVSFFVIGRPDVDKSGNSSSKFVDKAVHTEPERLGEDIEDCGKVHVYRVQRNSVYVSDNGRESSRVCLGRHTRTRTYDLRYEGHRRGCARRRVHVAWLRVFRSLPSKQALNVLNVAGHVQAQDIVSFLRHAGTNVRSQEHCQSELCSRL